MKSILILAAVLFLPFSLISQPHQQPEPGAWGGELIYQNQATEFYLEFRKDENGEMSAYTYMPVIPFPKRSIGEVVREDSLSSAGPIKFKIDTHGKKLTGSFPDSPRGLRFELLPITEFPPSKEPVSSRSTATPSWTFETDAPIWGPLPQIVNRFISAATMVIYIHCLSHPVN